MAMQTTHDQLLETYQRLSLLDFRWQRAGVSVDRRRALWAGLEEDPWVIEMLAASDTPPPMRDGLRADLGLCRLLRDRAWKEADDFCGACVHEALLAFFF